MEQKETARPRGTDSAKVIQVIVTQALEGSGTLDDPCRTQTKYWSLGGDLLAVDAQYSATQADFMKMRKDALSAVQSREKPRQGAT